MRATEQRGLDRVPVVLAHGWGGSYDTTWRGSRLESALRAAGRAIIRVDLPGHGPGPHAHDPDAYVNIAESFYRTFKHAPLIDAVGFSLGGKLLLDLACRRPASLRRIVVAGVGTNLFRPENGVSIAGAMRNPNADNVQPAVRRIVEAARSSGNDLDALAAVIQRPPSTLSPEALASITATVLLVAGRKDTFIGDVDQLRQLIRGAHAVLLDAIDHLGTPASVGFQDVAAAFLAGGPATNGAD